MRTPGSAEDRILRAFRQAGIITAAQQQAARDLLEATETCTKCGGTGMYLTLPCERCDGTGMQRVIR